MVLIQFLYAPGKVFADLKENGWALPFVASILLYLLSAVLLWHAVGTSGIISRGLEMDPGAFGRLASAAEFRPRFMLVIVLGTVVNGLTVLIAAWAILWAVRLIHTATSYGTVLA